MCEQLIRSLRFLATAEDATGMADSALAMREAAAELERLRKDAERLRDALKYYGTHSSACDMSRFINPAGCTCGYDAAAQQKKEPRHD